MRIVYYTNRILSIYDYIIKDSTLSKRVKVSTIAHVSILFFLLISSIIFPARYKYNRNTIHTVQLVSLPAIRPQQVTPPKEVPIKKTEPPVAKPVPKEPVKKTEVKETEVKKSVAKPVSKPIPKSNIKPLTTPTLEEKLKERLKKEFVEPEETTKSSDKEFAEPASTPLINIGVSSPSNFPFQYYLDIIHDKISSCWYEPQMVLDKQYTAIVKFIILKDGTIQGLNIKTGSGISNFDQSCIRAIEMAKPFPPLPPGFSGDQLIVNVAFSLE